MLSFNSLEKRLSYGVKVSFFVLTLFFITQLFWPSIGIPEIMKSSKPTTALFFLHEGLVQFISFNSAHLILFLCLFLFPSKEGFIMRQVIAFSTAYIVAMWLTMYHVIEVSSYILNGIIPLSIIYIALENIFAYKLKNTRIFFIFILGFIHGINIADSLIQIGLPESAFFTSLATVTLGAVLAQVAILFPSILFFTKWLASKHYHRYAYNVFSVSFVLIAVYWTVKQVFLQ